MTARFCYMLSEEKGSAARSTGSKQVADVFARVEIRAREPRKRDERVGLERPEPMRLARDNA